MDWGQLMPDVDRVLGALEAAQLQIAGDLKEGLRQGGLLRHAARSLGDSSSGSWVGWHARMYYGNFEEPQFADSWNTEWGGLGHVSDRWHEYTLPEVQRAIEDRAAVRLADTAQCADRVRDVCQPLQQELMTVLSPVCDLAGFAKEAELLAKLEKTDWIVAPEKFVRPMVPREVWSRDGGAMSQGVQTPLHLAVLAAIVSNLTTLTTSQEFLADAIRLARQVRTKLKAIPAGATVQAPSLGDAFNPGIQHQLRQRSRALFVLLAAVVVGGDVWLLRMLGHGPFVAAVVAAAGALAVAGAYAWLIDRGPAQRAIAALNRVLSRFPKS